MTLRNCNNCSYINGDDCPHNTKENPEPTEYDNRTIGYCGHYIESTETIPKEKK